MLQLMRRYLTRFSSCATKRPRLRPRFHNHARHLRLEPLEERLTFSAHSWTGAVSNLWSNAANWTGGSPAGDPNAVLQFPAGAANLANQNDLTGVKISELFFHGSGYTITGNAVTVIGAGGIFTSNNTTNTFSPNITLSSNSANFGASTTSSLILGGIMSGTSQITKGGLGTIILTRANTFTGSVLVSQGTINIRNAKALGAANSTLVQDGATLEVQGGITVAGESLHLGTVDNNGSGTAATLRNVSGTNTWTGPVNLNSNATINVAGTLLVSGVVKGADGPEFEGGDRLTKTGFGTLELSGTNTYTAFTEVIGGTLRIRNKSALGSTVAGTRVLTNSTLVLQEALIGGGETVPVLVGNESLDLNGTGFGNVGALRNLAGGNAWGGLVTLATTSKVHVDNGSLVLGGRVAGSGGLTKSGPAALFYNGPEINTYSGATQVTAGSLIVDKILNATAITVTNQAVLGGKGTTKTVTLQSGTLSPGDAGLSTAILRTEGNASLDATSNFDVTINGATAGTNFDQVLVTGRANLGGANLRVSGNGGAVNGTFTIFQATGGVAGTFNGLPNNSEFLLANGVRMRINYTSTQVTLTHLDTAPAFQNRQISTPIHEGEVATITGRISEPDTQDTFFLEVAWGDGSPTQFYRFDPGTPRDIAITHLYTDDQPSGTSKDIYSVDLFWHDQHGLGNRGTLDVSVLNLAPDVFVGGNETIYEDKQFRRTGYFVDPGHDRCVVLVDYGNGAGPQALKVGKENKFELRQHYKTPGKYRVTVIVQDDDGGITKVGFNITVLKKKK